jgi:hypothetical protein
MSILLMCLQVSPIDANSALDLARLIAALEKVRPSVSKPEWMISFRYDTPLSRISETRTYLLKEFPNVYLAKCHRFASGWPVGANALWAGTMETVANLNTQAEAVLTFEPDCVPLRLGWIDLLQLAYSTRVAPIVGNFHGDGDFLHVNGNAMFPIKLAKEWPQLLQTPNDAAWDYYHREFIRSHACDTNLITQYYRRKNLSTQEWPAITKNNVRPALLHGVKDASARRLAWFHLVPAKLPQTACKRLLQHPTEI